MEKHCTMVYFSLRESKQNKKGESPIEVAISANGERVYFSTGKSVNICDWNKTNQIVRGKTEQAELVNSYSLSVCLYNQTIKRVYAAEI